MTIHFTSDLHLGHRLVASHRGFERVEDHDQAIFDNWDRVVGKDDIVWVLGDITLNQPSQALAELHGLPGRKRLVIGNHDKVHPMHRDAPKWFPRYTGTFESIATSARVSVNGIEVLLSHFPYTRDRGEPRHLQWRLPDLGRPLLHGHTHGKERLVRTGSTTEVHVGVDAWDLTPVSDRQVHELLAT